MTPRLAALAASLRKQGIVVDEHGAIDAEASAAIGTPVTVDLIEELVGYGAEAARRSCRGSKPCSRA